MTKNLKRILGVALLIVVAFVFYKLVVAGDQEWERQQGTTPERVPILYGKIKPPELKSFLQSQDSVQKNISLDSVEYSKWYKYPYLHISAWILSTKWVADDSISTHYSIQLADSAGTWTTYDSTLFTQTDSGVTNVDTFTVGSTAFPSKKYFRVAFSGAADNKQGAGVVLVWSLTAIADTYTYWVGGTAEDTSATMVNPDLYTNWTLWYKYQHHDSSRLKLYALASYDLNYWLIADSAKLTAQDTLAHFKSWTLPRALAYKVRIDGDSGTPGANSDYDGNDSTAYMSGVMAKLWQIMTR